MPLSGRLALGLGCAFALSALGCGGTAPIAYENRTFYEYGFSGSTATSAFETAYPPLDYKEEKPNPEYMGVAILGGYVRISRPKGWIIRSASNQPGGRYIEYVSRNQYVFAVYERPDSPVDLWRDILTRYEDDVTKAGAEVVGSRIPIATWNAQGRAYVIKRKVAAAKAPFENLSREYLLRSDNRIVLVQIVHQGDSVEPISDELLRVVRTLQVL